MTGSGKNPRLCRTHKRSHRKRRNRCFTCSRKIALTAQIVSRLQKIFGDQIAVFHSRMNNNERVEIWRSVLAGKPLVMGARSGLFLPFKNLKLIIVDEEHDTSYKQIDPAPRYNARDVAVFFSANAWSKNYPGNSNTIFGILSKCHFKKNTNWLKCRKRFGGLELPEIVIVDAKEETKKQKNAIAFYFRSFGRTEKKHWSLASRLFCSKNRRGYAPTMRCSDCGWHSECIHCDVSLTYHKFHNNLRCHYCGYQRPIPTACPACGSKQLTLKGFGTEKIEDELKIFFPEAKIMRLDYDTARAKKCT